MTPEALAAIRDSVAAGEYVSTSEAIHAAVRLWRRDREEHQATLASIKARIQASIDDPRPRLSIEEVQTRMTRRFEALALRYPDETI